MTEAGVPSGHSAIHALFGEEVQSNIAQMGLPDFSLLGAV